MVCLDFVINFMLVFMFMKIVKHNLILHNIQEKIVMENVGNQLILLINHDLKIILEIDHCHYSNIHLY
jgi:hypothetical protein